MCRGSPRQTTLHAIWAHPCANTTHHVPYCLKESPLLQDRSRFKLKELQNLWTSNHDWKDNPTDNRCRIRKWSDIDHKCYVTGILLCIWILENLVSTSNPVQRMFYYKVMSSFIVLRILYNDNCLTPSCQYQYMWLDLQKGVIYVQL